MTQTIPAAAYLRRSTDKQEQSLDDQRTEIRKWSKANGYALVAEYVDDAISGTSSKGRGGFLKMIDDAKGGTFKAVIVWNSDRFSRGDNDETGHYRHLLREAGVKVVSVTEAYHDKAGMEGELLRAVKQVQNRQYCVGLAQNVVRGMASCVRAGGECGRRPPYGYRRQVRSPDGRLVEGIRKPAKDWTAFLVLGPEAEIATVREIFDLCVSGQGFSRIADLLNRKGIPSPRGGTWAMTSVRSLLKNPVYRGDLAWNQRAHGKFYGLRGQAIALREVPASKVEHLPETEWIIREGGVPGIVDRGTWQAAQVACRARSTCNNGRGRVVGRYLLSGLLQCGDCGHPLWGTKKANTQGYSTRYYVCAGQETRGRSVCPSPSARIRAVEIEGAVREAVRRCVFGDAADLADAVDMTVDRIQSLPAEASSNAARLREVEGTIKALVDQLDPENLVLANGKMNALRLERDRLLLAERSAADRTIRSSAEVKNRITAQMGLLRDFIDGREDEEVRTLLKDYVAEVRWTPNTRTGYVDLFASAMTSYKATTPAVSPRSSVSVVPAARFARPLLRVEFVADLRGRLSVAV
jgi:DNA invertase Pin-like site-specific DNA recombinase